MLSFSLIEEMRAAVAKASEQGQPLVVNGRDGCFSAGFDLKGDEQWRCRAWIGTLLGRRRSLSRYDRSASSDRRHHYRARARRGRSRLSVDYRVGRSGPYRVGFNEVAIGMALPSFAIAIAAHRLENRYLTTALTFSEIASPERALQMGYFDELVADPFSRACAMAQTLAGLPGGAYAATKRRVWRRLRQELAPLEGPR